MIEPEITFLQVKEKGRRAHSPKECASGFDESPEAFDPIDMGGGNGNKRIFPMIHPRVFLVPDGWRGQYPLASRRN
ncbi:MAG: hypothetical protein ACYCYP_08680 [Leptospirales bacterium]